MQSGKLKTKSKLVIHSKVIQSLRSKKCHYYTSSMQNLKSFFGKLFNIKFLQSITLTCYNYNALFSIKRVISSTQKITYFQSGQIKLETLILLNLKNYKQYIVANKTVRNQIETLFAQFRNQFIIRLNYAKTIHTISIHLF